MRPEQHAYIIRSLAEMRQRLRSDLGYMAQAGRLPDPETGPEQMLAEDLIGWFERTLNLAIPRIPNRLLQDKAIRMSRSVQSREVLSTHVGLELTDPDGVDWKAKVSNRRIDLASRTPDNEVRQLTAISTSPRFWVPKVEFIRGVINTDSELDEKALATLPSGMTRLQMDRAAYEGLVLSTDFMDMLVSYPSDRELGNNSEPAIL